MEVALAIMEEELKDIIKPKTEESKKTEPKKEKPTVWDNKEPASLSYGVMDDVPNVDIYKAAMVAELDMLNCSGLLDKEDQQELKRLQSEVTCEKVALEAYWKRSFGGEKKSNDSRH